jgi:hypothetical protein
VLIFVFLIFAVLFVIDGTLDFLRRNNEFILQNLASIKRQVRESPNGDRIVIFDKKLRKDLLRENDPDAVVALQQTDTYFGTPVIAVFTKFDLLSPEKKDDKSLYEQLTTYSITQDAFSVGRSHKISVQDFREYLIENCPKQ